MTATVDCPTCGRPSVFAPSNRWRPFCSERCKMIDLGVWASGGYAIPGDAPDPEDPSPDEGSPPRPRGTA
jgi:endogenous inhibitor of DNA gyrase (YacG/DUF329 family)